MDAALALLVPGAALAGALVAGLGVRRLPAGAVAGAAIAAVAVACAASLLLGWRYLHAGAPFTVHLYDWGPPGLGLRMGFLIDSLSVVMCAVVTAVSLLVHVYSLGYMRGDPGFRRFFAYLALFTLAMLLLVLADNFLLLFLGWEGVGLVSYLLIGFWYTRDSAQAASLKAFLVNRLGDFGFLLGMAALLAGAGSLEYAAVFARADALAAAASPLPGVDLLTLACLLLFLGAMGKSAQVPLHVWLPDSMEGPTPISAMIHAATMVTAGIFMVARLSPLFEGSETALNAVLLVGAVTAFATALLGLAATDIKRVLACSTLSQLGYMVAALGASAYAAGIFHLFTHAFFKALLFLAAGSAILALHHEQDLRRMGGLGRRLPWTAATFAVGALALAGVPGFAGFYSKETIIETLARSELALAPHAHALLVGGVAVTALYMLRLWRLAFAGAPRSDAAAGAREPGWTVRGPLLALAALTLAAPLAAESFLVAGLLDDALASTPGRDPLAAVAAGWNGLAGAVMHAPETPAFAALAGAVALWLLLGRRLVGFFDGRAAVARLLRWQYGFDALYERLAAGAARGIAGLCARLGERRLIDGGMVAGAVAATRRSAAALRAAHTGLLNHAALGMMLGLALGLGWLLLRD